METSQEIVVQKKRAGAPRGNRNAARHGLRGSNLPAGCTHILRATNGFRQRLETAVLELRGEVSIHDACQINTAYRAERHAQLAQRWLSTQSDHMDHVTRLAYSREVVKASAERDKAVAALRLDQKPADLWAAFYGQGQELGQLRAAVGPREGKEQQ